MKLVPESDFSEEFPQGALEVAVVEALEKDEGDEEGENKIDDGDWVITETVVHGPVSGQDMEQVVFDFPAGVTDLPEHLGGEKEDG